MTADALITLRPLDVHGADREDLLAFLTGETFPFHVLTRRNREEVEQGIENGAWEGEENRTYWLEHREHGRIGLIRLEDLQDPTPLFDLRLAERFRGHGLGAPTLQAVTEHVFTTMPEVQRFEGETRADNLAMQRIFARCGWTLEAHYRETWPSAKGDSADGLAYAIQRREWEAQAPGFPTSAARTGPRPRTSDEGPHRQLDQNAPPALWGELVARVFALPGVIEGHSQVSPADSRAVHLVDLPEELAPQTNLAPGRRLEPVHLHGVSDTSVHLALPPERGQELEELSWGEPHGYADFGTEMMIYGPRDHHELEVVLGVIREALAFARNPRPAPERP